MSEVSHRILIGAYGWLHQAWQDSFYPDGLPEDWQLGYYSNEFPVIMLPAAYGQQGESMIELALEDSAESLHIVYEAPVVLQRETAVAEAVSTLEAFARQIIGSGHHGAAVVVLVKGVDFPFGELLQGLDITIPLIFAFAADMDSAQCAVLLPLFKEHGVGLCWSGGAGAEALAFGPVALTIIREQLDMRQLRGVIETILSRTTAEQDSILIFQGEPPDLELMRNAAVMLDLF